MVKRSYKDYYYIPIGYIEELARLREKIRKMQNESKIHKNKNNNIR